MAVGKALESNSALTVLSMEHNKIGKEGLTAILKALRNYSRTLTGLNLQFNKTVLGYLDMMHKYNTKAILELNERQKVALERKERKKLTREKTNRSGQPQKAIGVGLFLCGRDLKD